MKSPHMWHVENKDWSSSDQYFIKESMDGSHSWIRISSGLNKFVRDLTEKARIHGDNEHTLAGTGEPVTQDSKSVQK